MLDYNMKPFRFWCQKVLPLVYDDSLSYMELLCKVVNYLNHVIEDINGIPDYINQLISEDKLKEIMTELMDELREQVARANEGTNTTASYDRTAGELVWLNGKLVRMTRNILAGDRYIEDTGSEGVTGNYVFTSVEMELTRIKDALASEITARQEADTQLQDAIDGEVTARQEADNTLRELIENHVQFITPQKFGAIGDGVANDTNAVQQFFNACLNGEVGFVPAGTYLCTSQILIDYSSANVRQLKIFGAGCYRSTFKSSIVNGVAFLFTSGTLFDSFHTVISDVGFTSTSNSITLQIGKDDYSDALGNFNWSNVFVANYSNNVSSVACRMNYMFDCIFTNCVFICNAQGNGDALQLRLVRFTNFIGGSYSNANKGIHFTGATCDTLTFIGCDFENLDYGVYIDSISQYIKFITCYFDIWRPDLTPPTYGKHAVYSTLNNFQSTGMFTFENVLFARGGIYGNGGIDTEHINGVKFIGRYSYPSPAQPTADAGTVEYTNNSGLDLMCFTWITNDDDTSHIDSYNINNDIFENVNTNVQCGANHATNLMIYVPVGATIQVNYTGTIYWVFRPLG